MDIVGYRCDRNRLSKIVVGAEEGLNEAVVCPGLVSRRPIRHPGVIRRRRLQNQRRIGRKGRFVLDILRLLGLAAVMPAIDVQLEAQSIRGVPVEDRANSDLVWLTVPVSACLAVLPALTFGHTEGDPAEQSTAYRPADEAVDLARVEPTIGKLCTCAEIRRRFICDIVDGATGGVVAEKRPLRTL